MTPLLPDPTQLAEQLEHARDARTHLDRVVAWLEQGLQLLGPGTGAADHAPLPPAPSEPSPEDVEEPQRQLKPPEDETPSHARTGDAETEQAVDEASSGDPAVSQPPADEEGQRQEQEGAAPAAPSTLHRPPRRSSGGGGELLSKLHSAVIRSNQPLSADQLAERAGVEKDNAFRRAIKKLVDDGKLIATGATKGRRYTAAPKEGFHTEAGRRTAEGREKNRSAEEQRIALVVLRDRVLKAIAADPRQLNEDRLALALDADRHQITNACEALVMTRKIVRLEDGTYTRDTRMEVAA